MNELSPAIKQSGYGISGDIGGLPRQTYYTPDGRVVRAIACIRQYAKKDKDGKVIESGTRDANYDKGWLPIMPTELKPHCPYCGEWHDIQEEIDACGARIKKQTEWGNRVARKSMKQDSGDMDNLKKEVAELKEMLQRALEVKGG